MFPSAVVSLFEEIRKGTLFPMGWLATADHQGGRVRTVRLSGFNLQQEKFFISTHRRHAKMEQVQRNPVGELCLTEQGGPIQLRFRCQLRALGEPEQAMRESQWRRVSDDGKWRYYGCEATRQVPPPDFVVLEGSVFEVDLLDLRPEFPLRRGYRKTEEGWQEETRLV